MTTRSQKRKAAEELISTEIETPLPENTTGENPIVGTSKSPKVTTDSLENIKSMLRKEIMSDLTKILAENQKETLKLIALTVRKQTVLRSTEDSDSDSENIPENATSTPIKSKTNATSSKITPNNSRNNMSYYPALSKEFHSYIDFLFCSAKVFSYMVQTKNKAKQQTEQCTAISIHPPNTTTDTPSTLFHSCWTHTKGIFLILLSPLSHTS